MATQQSEQSGKEPTVSVVVPVLNGMPLLEDQLRALVTQDYARPYEVVIADNGSTDGTIALAESWSARHPTVRLVDASARRGAPAARNLGVDAARAPLIAFCDADDVVQVGWLKGCVHALGSADVVAGYYDFWTLNGTPPAPNQAATVRQLGFLPAGLTANLAVRRAAFERASGFNEELFLGDDIDLCWKIQLNGDRFALAPDAVVAKRDRTTFRSVFDQTFSYGKCGPRLHRTYRAQGARRDLVGALKSWTWLALHLPLLVFRRKRIVWACAAGMRLGRLRGSLDQRVFFP